MSQLSTATTIARRPSQRRGPRAERDLRVLTAADATGSPWFPVLLVTLLLAGLAAVLALNTAMAKDSFELGRLEARSAELSETREALVQDVNARSAPQALAARAGQLGMVPSEAVAFVDLEQGEVLGVAKAAEEPEGFSVDAAASATGEKASDGQGSGTDGGSKDEGKADDKGKDKSEGEDKGAEKGTDKAQEEPTASGD